MDQFVKKASVLIEAIPYIQEFRRKIFVIKYGGSILDNDAVRKNVLEDIVFLSYVGILIILVHGGGPYISKQMKKAGLEPRFIHGRRVTDGQTVQIIDKALHAINRKIVNALKGMGAKAFGMSGKDGGLIKAKKLKYHQEHILLCLVK